jgi:hypothetical protein
MLVVACVPQIRLRDILILSVLTLVCYGALTFGFHPGNISNLDDFIFYLPVAYATYLYLRFRPKADGTEQGSGSQATSRPVGQEAVTA